MEAGHEVYFLAVGAVFLLTEDGDQSVHQSGGQEGGNCARADRQQDRGQGTVSDDDRGGGHQDQAGGSPESRPLP